LIVDRELVVNLMMLRNDVRERELVGSNTVGCTKYLAQTKSRSMKLSKLSRKMRYCYQKSRIPIGSIINLVKRDH